MPVRLDPFTNIIGVGWPSGGGGVTFGGLVSYVGVQFVSHRIPWAAADGWDQLRLGSHDEDGWTNQLFNLTFNQIARHWTIGGWDYTSSLTSVSGFQGRRVKDADHHFQYEMQFNWTPHGAFSMGPMFQGGYGSGPIAMPWDLPFFSSGPATAFISDGPGEPIAAECICSEGMSVVYNGRSCSLVGHAINAQDPPNPDILFYIADTSAGAFPWTGYSGLEPWPTGWASSAWEIYQVNY